MGIANDRRPAGPAAGAERQAGFGWRRGPGPLGSTAGLGRGIWGKGMEDGEAGTDRSCHGNPSRAARIFPGARLCARRTSRSRLTAGDGSDSNGCVRRFGAAAAGPRRTQPRSLGCGCAALCASDLGGVLLRATTICAFPPNTAEIGRTQRESGRMRTYRVPIAAIARVLHRSFAAPRAATGDRSRPVSVAAPPLGTTTRQNPRVPRRFSAARTVRPRYASFHSFAPNSPAQLGCAHERLRPAPPPKSRVSLRVRSASGGRRALADSGAPFPLHALRPGPVALRFSRDYAVGARASSPLRASARREGRLG